VTIGYYQVSGDDCYRCGYDLRGIASDRACPECGLLAERSRRVSDELHNSRPKWLRKLSRGIWLILLALVLLIVLSILIEQSRAWILESVIPVRSWAASRLALGSTPLVAPGIGAAIFLLGILMLTTREQYGPADRADRLRRTLLRILAVFPLLKVIAETAIIGTLGRRIGSFGFPYALSDEMEWLSFVASAVVLTASIPLPALLFYQLRSLAKRARSAHLAEHCTIVGIGMSSAILYGTAVLFTFQFAEQWGLATTWASRSPVSLVLILLCTLLAALFALWSIYLLVRFAIAFHLAARQLGQKWKRDDRAA
jgi:hypothetical protein